MSNLDNDLLREILEEINKPVTDEEAIVLDKKYGFSQLTVNELSRLYHNFEEKYKDEHPSANEEELEQHNALYQYSKSNLFKARYTRALAMTESSSSVYLYHANNFGKFSKGKRVKVFKSVDVSRSIMPRVGTSGIVSHHTWQVDKRDWRKFYDQYDLVWVKFTLPVIDQDNCVWLADGDLDDKDFCDKVSKEYNVASIGIYREEELLVGFKPEELLLD